MTGFLVLFPLIVVGVARLIFLSGIRVIPNTCLDIVEKRFGPSRSVENGFIALNGEAGFQPRVLRVVSTISRRSSMLSTPPLVTIPQGKLGYVFAPDGKLLDPTLI